MRIFDIIENKKFNKEHTKEEIDFLIKSMMSGQAADYQISAWLMAACINGLTTNETEYLTRAIIESGTVLDLSQIEGDIVDKHSSGGVGDKVSIILVPLLAAAGMKVAKLSGRGLGLTGGTIDKLESIPNFNCALEEKDFLSQVQGINCAIASQTKNLTPADAKLYALRDVTATIENIGLMCASIISKKIAAGTNHIILDVTYGSGAFIKTKEKAEELANLMVEVAKRLGKKVCAVITSMEEPLGLCVGNSIEIIESIEFLKGNMAKDVREVTFKIASLALTNTGRFQTQEEACEYLENLVTSKHALNKLKELIEAQGGNSKVIDDYSIFKQPKYTIEIFAKESGCVEKVEAEKIAYASKILGAGRDRKEEDIDFSAGVKLFKQSGQKVEIGEKIAEIYTDKEEKIDDAIKIVEKAFAFCQTAPSEEHLIYKTIK